jgi:hypothetical protein
MKNSISVSATLWAALFLSATLALAGSGSQPSITSQAAFERVKGLAGEWRGTVDERGTGPKATVTYRVTSDGTAVIETLFPGTEHEMVTLYHLEGGMQVLTHYCAMANQPKMALAAQSTPDLLILDLAGGANVNPRKDMHMHSVRIRFDGKDALESEWDVYQGEKKVDCKKFFLSRKS